MRLEQSDAIRTYILDNVRYVLQDFNDRIIQMYFSSILGNLFDAQYNVRRITLGEEAVQVSLASYIHEPFLGLPESFTSVVSHAESLGLLNQDWQSQQETFSLTTQELLQHIAEELQGRLIEKDEYRILKEHIGQLNVLNAQHAVHQQAAADEEHYYAIFHMKYLMLLEQLDGFHSDDITNNQHGVMQELIMERDDIADTLQDRITALITLIELLHEQADDLYLLRANLAEAYFGCITLTPDTATEAHVRRAILALTDIPELTDTNLNQAFFTRLHADMERLTLCDLRDIIQVLQLRNLIPYIQMTEYMMAISLIERYAYENGLTFDTSRNFLLIDTEDEVFPSVVSFEQVVNVPFDTSETNTLVLSSLDHLSIDPEVSDALRLRIITDLNAALGESGTASAVLASDHRSLTVHFHPTPVMDPYDPPPSMPTHIPLSIDVNILWHLSNRWIMEATNDERVFNETEFSLFLNGNTIASSPLAFAVNIHQANLTFLQEDFSLFLSQFGLLERVANQMVMLFGEASPSGQTLVGFYDLLARNNNGTIREHAAANSVYWSYAQLTHEALSHAIADSLVTDFSEQGSTLWNDVDQHLNRLRTTIDGDGSFEALTDLLSALPTPKILSNEIQALLNWNQEIRHALSNYYSNWNESPVLLLELVAYCQSGTAQENDIRLFYDIAAGNQLLLEMQMLVDSSVLMSLSTSEMAADIQSLEDQFSTLITQTEEVHMVAQTVLNEMCGLMEDFVPQVESNIAFATNFSEVLSNARIGGADNPEVMQFLASPVEPVRTIIYREGQLIHWWHIVVLSAFIPVALVLGMIIEKRQLKTRDDARKLG